MYATDTHEIVQIHGDCFLIKDKDGKQDEIYVETYEYALNVIMEL